MNHRFSFVKRDIVGGKGVVVSMRRPFRGWKPLGEFRKVCD